MAQWPITNVFNPPSEPGTDYGTPTGTPLYAPLSGTVTTQDTGGAGWGKSVHIKPNVSALDFIKAFASGGSVAISEIGAGHLSSFAVRSGQYVQAGQLIGYTGNTGDSTGPHVELFIKNTLGRWLDPTHYPAVVEGFFNSRPGINATGSSDLSTDGNPVQGALDAALNPVGAAITGATNTALKSIGYYSLMLVGGLLMALGLALLVYAVTGFNPVDAAKKVTPQGRALSVVQGGGGRRKPAAAAAPKPAPAAPSEPEYRAGNRIIEMSPAARARLRERMAAS